MELTGVGALVTGAARRIGRATALALARCGAHVVVHYNTSEEEAQEVVREITDAGGRALCLAADLRESQQAIALMDKAHGAVRELGAEAVQVLVNNASVFVPQSFETTNAERMGEDLSVHLESPFWLSQGLRRQLPHGRPGRIINLLDWRATIPDPKYASYGVSKGALYSLTRTLATALGPDILVNGVAPGAVLAASGGGENPKELLAPLPIPRMGCVEDVVEAVMYLIEKADYTTGAVIPVDGGRHLL